MDVDYAQYPILFVDDEPANLVALSYVLEGRFRVLTATSGEEALRILSERDDIALLVCDQRMPGMTGVQVCERAREVRPQVVRMILTAYSDMHDAIAAINRGQVQRYISKPFRNEELVDILRTSLDMTHLQRTVQDMQTRLLQSGQAHAARTVQNELAHEAGNYLSPLENNLEVLGDAIGGAADLLSTDPARAAALLGEAREIHGDALTLAGQLRALVNRFRRGEQPAVAAPGRCDAARAIDSAVRFLRNELERRARVQVMVDATPTVPLDPVALGQVMMNLLLNAAQALVGRGDGTIAVRVGAVDGRCVIHVTDDGPGIPSDQLERIFDPFVTTKQGSHGLGLAIVREIVHSAGGRVAASSEPGVGTRFTIDLPIV